MYYLCFASRTNGDVRPATRILVFIAKTGAEFKVNLQLAKDKWGKNYLFECVRIRHDGNFHMDILPLEEYGL